MRGGFDLSMPVPIDDDLFDVECSVPRAVLDSPRSFGRNPCDFELQQI